MSVTVYSRQWTIPPEEIRKLCGPAANSWTDDQLYAVNGLMTWTAKQALEQHRKRRLAAILVEAQADRLPA